MQFPAGDRAGDNANLVTQEVMWLRNCSGLVQSHFWENIIITSFIC